MARPISNQFLNRVTESGEEGPLIVDRVTLTSPPDLTDPTRFGGVRVLNFVTSIVGQRPDPATGEVPRLIRVEGLRTDLGTGPSRILLALENDQVQAEPGERSGYIGYQVEYLRVALDRIDVSAVESGVVLLSGV
ncbi:MAG: hypothetical protein ACOYLF_16395, partial [Blastocatellia bacterium]